VKDDPAPRIWSRAALNMMRGQKHKAAYMHPAAATPDYLTIWGDGVKCAANAFCSVSLRKMVGAVLTGVGSSELSLFHHSQEKTGLERLPNRGAEDASFGSM
jgi:hypothetical protein